MPSQKEIEEIFSIMGLSDPHEREKILSLGCVHPNISNSYYFLKTGFPPSVSLNGVNDGKLE